jgi:hypothetical protein
MLSLSISRRFRLQERFNEAASLKRLLGNPEGLRCDSAELALHVVTRTGDTRKLRFFFDTGSDLMVIPIYVARYAGIAFRQDYPGTLASSVGGATRCFYDFVEVRSSLSGKTHRWVCAFADSVQARLILGRSGFFDEFEAAVRGQYLVASRAVSLSRFVKHHIGRLRTRGVTADEWEPI